MFEELYILFKTVSLIIGTGPVIKMYVLLLTYLQDYMHLCILSYIL